MSWCAPSENLFKCKRPDFTFHSWHPSKNWQLFSFWKQHNGCSAFDAKMSVELTSGLWYENVADAFEPESRLSMGLKEKPQMLDCQDYQITRVPPLSMLVNRLSKAPETSLMILYYVVKISVFFTFVMNRNLKFLHMPDFSPQIYWWQISGMIPPVKKPGKGVIVHPILPPRCNKSTFVVCKTD